MVKTLEAQIKRLQEFSINQIYFTHLLTAAQAEGTAHTYPHDDGEAIMRLLLGASRLRKEATKERDKQIEQPHE
jgi:hypothetical protein